MDVSLHASDQYVRQLQVTLKVSLQPRLELRIEVETIDAIGQSISNDITLGGLFNVCDGLDPYGQTLVHAERHVLGINH